MTVDAKTSNVATDNLNRDELVALYRHLEAARAEFLRNRDALREVAARAADELSQLGAPEAPPPGQAVTDGFLVVSAVRRPSRPYHTLGRYSLPDETPQEAADRLVRLAGDELAAPRDDARDAHRFAEIYAAVRGPLQEGFD